MKTLQEFLDKLAIRESNGNYKAVNRFGYIGKYQMGEASLIDCGYYRKSNNRYNNDWSGVFIGKDGVYSLEDFLNNSIAQENAIRKYMSCQWRYLKALNLQKYTGKQINGFVITKSGMLAGAHLKGAKAVADYLNSNGKNISKDGFGTSIEAYMKNFANYQVDEICR